MSGITDIVQQHLTPETINQISQAIGADPATTQQAIDAAVPMIVGGMANHAATPAGAATIQNEAENHAGILGQLGGMLGGAGGIGGVLGGLGGMLGGAGGEGGGLGGMLGSAAAGGILGKVLGSSHADVTNGVTQATGLDTQKATKLLMILAPIVLAAIAHHRSTANASPGQVGDVLQQEAQTQAASHRYGGILGGILNKATGQA
ncbi:MAG TPA: DUF937 domain-containing protein [Gemmatimonadaceae bacterium]|nr:DUF937 domain-containing protein [Gemmatimonadaceae bacterium]